MNRSLVSLFGLAALLPSTSGATEFESKKDAFEKVLGKSAKVFKKTYTVEGKPYDLFYSKDASGNVAKFVAVQSWVYAPDCTHTWVIGMKAKPQVEVEQVRVLEMKCKHAFPAKQASFLGQFEGKKISDAKTLDKTISLAATATATYTAVETTNAVRRSLMLAAQFKP